MCKTPLSINSMCSYPTKPFQYAASPASCSALFGPLKYSSITAVTGLIEDGISLTTTFSNADADAPLSSSCLSINTIFTLMKSGVGVLVGEDVTDGVNVFVAVGVLVLVDVDVNVAGFFVDVVVGVNVNVREGGNDGVKDGVGV